MDRFLTKNVGQKNDFEFTKLGPAVCVLGKSGIGKTWTVTRALQPHVELTAEILRSRQTTVDFLSKIEGTETHVILDEYECVQDLIGLNEITKPPTNGIFCVVSQVPVKFSFEIVTWEFPVPTAETIRRIVPDATDQVIAMAKGDLRFVIRSLNFAGDAPDDFQGPREFVTDLVSVYSRSNPVDYIGQAVQEPGNVASILHENYVDSKTCDHALTADFFSSADLFETKVYAGDWELFPYYNVFGTILPAATIGHTLRPPLRPGSTWTKYQNMCMRTKRISLMASRTPGKTLTLDELLVLREYAEHGIYEPLRDYQFQKQDIDVLNHLSPLRKMKARTVAVIKKALMDT